MPIQQTNFVLVKAKSSASIILRGANDFMIDEMERSVHDALSVVRRVIESNSVCPGGGACEAALSIYLGRSTIRNLMLHHKMVIIFFLFLCE